MIVDPKVMRRVADAVKRTLPAKKGFIVLAFDFGPDGDLCYVANAQREDCLKAMQEFIDKNRNPGKWATHERPQN